MFRHWYVEELIGQLRQAANGSPPTAGQTFEQRLLTEIDTVAAAERAADRAARLNCLAAKLAGAVTPQEVAHLALTEAVTVLGASGGGLLLTTGDRVLEVAGTVGYDEAVVARLGTVSRDADLPAAVAARAGETVWLESRKDRDASFPALAGFEADTEALCAVPLVAGDRCLGALRLSFARPHLFGDDEQAFVLTMALQTAQALDRAILYREQSETAQRLQQSLLPPALPAVERVNLATRYDTSEAVEIGGDFYDILRAEPDWTFVVGDVRGKGIDAAALTAMARHTVRSGALGDLDPKAIRELLNEAFLAQESDESFCTALCGRLTIGTDHATLTVATGGHPRPMLVRADGTVEPIPCRGMLVGAFPEAVFGTAIVSLHPGDLVLMYTDGLTEARRGSELFGAERLQAELAASAGGSAESVLQQLHAAVAAFQTRQRDDMAMLALRLLSAAA